MSDALNRLTAAVARVGIGIASVAAAIKAHPAAQANADDSDALNNLASQLEGFGHQLQDIASAETVTTSDVNTSTNGTAEQTSDTAGNSESAGTSESTSTSTETSGTSGADASATADTVEQAGGTVAQATDTQTA